MENINGNMISAWSVPYVANALDMDLIVFLLDDLIAILACFADAGLEIPVVLNVDVAEPVQAKMVTLEVKKIATISLHFLKATEKVKLS